MKRLNLHDAPIDKLVERYAEIGVAQDQCIELNRNAGIIVFTGRNRQLRTS